MNQDPDELLEIPFVLWYMWKTNEPLMKDSHGRHSTNPLYSLFVMPGAAETLINSRYIKVNHTERGYQQFELTEEGKEYCEALFGNKGKA